MLGALSVKHTAAGIYSRFTRILCKAPCFVTIDPRGGRGGRRWQGVHARKMQQVSRSRKRAPTPCWSAGRARFRNSGFPLSPRPRASSRCAESGVTPPGFVPTAASITPTATINRVTHFSLLDAGVSTPRERRNLSMRDRVWQWLHRRRDTDWCKTVTRCTRAKLTI